MDAIIQNIETRIFTAFYRPETCLFYDYRTAEGLGHLPALEEIALQFPNPCGWGTGMEDSMLHAGAMLDALAAKGDRERAEWVLEGIRRCTTVHGVPGFAVRSLSPSDGKSCYSNSSRDQFTLAVFGAWRFRRTWPDSEKAAEILRSIAGYCRKNVTENLLRLDGKPAIVSRVWGDCEAHEALRLAMFYAAAGCEAEARRYFEPGLRRTLAMKRERPWWDIELGQMQLSLELLRESGLFPEAEDELRRAMRLTGELALERFLEMLGTAEEFTGDWRVPNANWRTLPFRMVKETLAENPANAVFGGRTYLNPVFPEDYRRVFNYLRGFGNYAVTIHYAPGLEVPRERLEKLLSKIDFSRVNTGGIIPLYQSLVLLNVRKGARHEAEIHSY